MLLEPRLLSSWLELSTIRKKNWPTDKMISLSLNKYQAQIYGESVIDWGRVRHYIIHLSWWLIRNHGGTTHREINSLEVRSLLPWEKSAIWDVARSFQSIKWGIWTSVELNLMMLFGLVRLAIAFMVFSISRYWKLANPQIHEDKTASSIYDVYHTHIIRYYLRYW